MPIRIIQCERNGWILQPYVTAANVHDNQAFFELFERVKREIQSCPETVCADAGYKPPIARYLLEQGVKRIWPYTRPKTKDGFFRENQILCMTNILIVIYVPMIKFFRNVVSNLSKIVVIS